MDETFTGIPNRVLTALARFTLPAYEMRVLLVVYRNVWGWQGRTGWFTSGGKIARAAGIPKAKAQAALKALHEKHLIELFTKSGGTYIVPSREPLAWRLPEKDRPQCTLPLGPLDITRSKSTGTPTGSGKGSEPEPLQGPKPEPLQGPVKAIEINKYINKARAGGSQEDAENPFTTFLKNFS